MSEIGERIGLIDGSQDSDSRTFRIVLRPEALVQLDELLMVNTELPSGDTIQHYGIVTELYSRLEGAELPSDTARAFDNLLPTEHVRCAEVRVLRVQPETFVPPNAGSAVYRARGEHREWALFEDEMKEGKLPLGLDLSDQVVHGDMRFVDGRAGGHVSISGISGVATKTSYALFLIYQLLETDLGRELLGGRSRAENTRVIVFNTKGEDLLHLDRPNSRFGEEPSTRERWAKLGVDDPGPFKSVSFYAPRAPGVSNPVSGVKSRATKDVQAYGWTPEGFVREQLLQFCFTAADERTTQVGFVEQHVRIQLLRRARRPTGDDSGAIVLLNQVPPGVGYNPDRLAAQEMDTADPGKGKLVRDFGDLIDLLDEVVSEDDEERLHEWFGRATAGTRGAFLRRLMKIRKHIDPLVGGMLETVSERNGRLHVVDISTLHADAQRFVVGALLDKVWRDKQGSGREPLRFVVLDELNKYAPDHGYSPLKELLVDIAERGRSLGVLLIGAQQAASAVAPAIPRNASIKVAGRLDAGESGEYRFLAPGLRERATRFLPGTMVVSQPTVPEPIPIRFPFPPFATNPDEAVQDSEETSRSVQRVKSGMAAVLGTDTGL